MRHPLTPFFHDLHRMTRPARALGYAMPAEWGPLARVWLTPPHHRDTWPRCLGKARDQYRAWMREMARYVELATTPKLRIPTDDSWIRDYGPIFVVRRKAPDGQAPVAAHDFRFNAWGGKYGLRHHDDMVPQHIASQRGLPIWIHDFVLEGGSIDVNGCGTVLTTEQCLLHRNRNPRKNRREIIEYVHNALGTWHAIWLPGGIAGDDTDGHVDDIARFVNPTTIVAVRASPDHPDHEVLERNWRVLNESRDQDGRRLTIIPLPAPTPPLHYDFPRTRYFPAGRRQLPASYANFLFVNKAVFVPIFNGPKDQPALRSLEQAIPDRKIIPVRAEHMVVGLGSLHCLSQQEPAAP